MGFSNGGQKIKVHRRMVFPMIQRAGNYRSVRRALPVYDNAMKLCQKAYTTSGVANLRTKILYRYREN